MSGFSFTGTIFPSKSVLNRALVVKSFFPSLQILGESICDDVRSMKNALQGFLTRSEIDCGEAGTVFRFMALRVSREKGSWKLKGSRRLLERPHQDLIFILEQLGVSAQLTADSLLIVSEGWKKPLVPLQIRRDKSSQFASALLINSWQLPFGLEFEMKGQGISEGYWELSVSMAEQLGMRLEKRKESYYIPAGQILKETVFKAELDLSSAFVVAAAAALAGSAEITNSVTTSWQPDIIFIDALKRLGVPVVTENSVLKVSQPVSMRAIDMNLAASPDLFPVLAVLCAFADGKSRLSGAPHLALKESDRIKKTAELLTLAGSSVTVLSDGLTIQGMSPRWKPPAFTFDPDQDHRMAMAAGLLKLRDFPVTVLTPYVVSKSFPDFWKILGRNP